MFSSVDLIVDIWLEFVGIVLGGYRGTWRTNWSGEFPGHGCIWLDQEGGPTNIPSLSEISLREETQATLDSLTGDGFVVNIPSGVWRFGRGSSGLHYLDDREPHPHHQNPIVPWGPGRGVEGHMVVQVVVLPPVLEENVAARGAQHQEDVREILSHLGDLWVLRTEQNYAVRFMTISHGADWTRQVRAVNRKLTPLDCNQRLIMSYLR